MDLFFRGRGSEKVFENKLLQSEIAWKKISQGEPWEKKIQRKQVFSTNQVLCWSQQTKKPKPCITTVIEHDGRFRKHEPQRVSSAFHECSQTSIVIYYSVIHGLGFFICPVM